MIAWSSEWNPIEVALQCGVCACRKAASSTQPWNALTWTKKPESREAAMWQRTCAAVNSL
jgi:hypothetical protein